MVSCSRRLSSTRPQVCGWTQTACLPEDYTYRFEERIVVRTGIQRSTVVRKGRVGAALASAAGTTLRRRFTERLSDNTIGARVTAHRGKREAFGSEAALQ